MSELKVFFSTEKGISSTSANTVANYAKECIREQVAFLDNLNFVSQNIQIIGTEVINPTTIGYTQQDIEQIEDAVRTVAEAQALMAYLREAIKQKERMLLDVQNLDILTICDILGLDTTCLTSTVKKETTPSEEDILHSFNLDEVTRYYTLEAKSAAIGNIIHQEGSFSKARKGMMKAKHNPTSTKGEGNNTTITFNSVSVPIEEVDKVYFNLQQLHRNYQKELNSIKQKVKDQLQKEKLRINHDYTAALNERSHEEKLISSEAEKFKELKLQEISALKIVIPDALQECYTKYNVPSVSK